MKKFTKGLLTILLVVSVIATACVFSGVFANAQAMQTGVGMDFTGADNTWVTLSGTTIQDEALEVEITNASGNKPIVLHSISSSSTGIRYTGWQDNKVVSESDSASIKISGTTAAEKVLYVTIKYYVQGNPVSTAETCTAYIFASAKQNYTRVTAQSRLSGGVHWNLKNVLSITPISSGSANVVKTTTDFPWYQGDQDVETGNINATIYVDGDRYKTFDELNMKMGLEENGERKFAELDSITITQTSDTGSMDIEGVTTNPQSKTATSTFSSETKTGFIVEDQEKNGETTFDVKGTIPTETTAQTYTFNFRTFGQTGGIVAGWGSDATNYVYPQIKLTVYNVNKYELKTLLRSIAQEGLNKASYTKTSWDTFYSKLEKAYEVFGTLNATLSEVNSAVSQLRTAYNGLVRLAVVQTNHYFYYGKNNKNPVLIEDQTVIEMDVANKTAHAVKPLEEGTYQIIVEDEYGNLETKDITFNRSNTTTSVDVNVNADSNYTVVVDQYYWYVDYTELEAAILAQANRVHKDEAGHDMYTAETWNAYVAAAQKGEKAKSDESLFQVNIDNLVIEIQQAADNLERIIFDTPWLDSAVGWAEMIINNDFSEIEPVYNWNTNELFASGYSQELYNNLVEAYNNAVEVIDSLDYTQAKADRAALELWEVINTLRVSDERGILIVENERFANSDMYGWYIDIGDPDNLTENRGLSVVLEDILDNTRGDYRLKASDFKEESWHALLSAIYGEFDPEDYSEDFFTAENFDEALFYSDQLGGETEAYPVNSSAESLTIPAYSMLNNIWFLASQDDYNAARDNLIAKVNSLEWDVDAAPLVEAVAQANEYDLSQYTNSSSAKLRRTLEYVEGMLEKLDDDQLYGDPEAVTNIKVNEAVTAIASGIRQLQLKPVLVPVEEQVELSEFDGKAIIEGETSGKTAAEIIEDFNINNNNENTVVVVYDSENNVIDDTEKVGTGYKIALESTDGEEVFNEFVFIIDGDVKGNAQIDQEDFNCVFNFAFTHSGIESDSIYFLAGDVNGDGKIDLSDAIMINRMAAQNN